ncbi:hypothetical protein [Methylobacter sp.]|uniref:hypothetical protein n=1 Tax=Methylobacter sp. TaxID=2051955 RepID=UPI002489A0AD|nr:hypothetical protein [Methylobacter sp.]MDI1279652.1 hypothetical protein [Methylobacter sp.]
MDDYTGAYIARKNDISVLPKHHAIAIFHLGGIAVECRLKSLLLLYHQISDWDQKSRRIKDSMYNQPIANPSHGLLSALRRMSDISRQAKLDKQFLTHLQKILYPLGSTDIDYISLRYIPQTTQSQEDWQKSFDYVCGWLEKNERILL